MKEEMLKKDQTIIDEDINNVTNIGNATKPKTLREALSKFQELNISALKETSNDYFKSKYADLTAVINAVNHGAQFGLSFDQAVNYENIQVNVKTTRTDKQGNSVETMTTTIIRDTYVTTTIAHDIDKETLTCRVPVLINSNDKDNPHKLGSGITYAKRYGLQSLYGLASDDDGNEASKDNDGKVPNAKVIPTNNNDGGAF